MKTPPATTPFSCNRSGVKGMLRFIFVSLAVLSACHRDQEAVTPAASFEGYYEGTKANEATYAMTIKKKESSRFHILNFGGFLNAPLEATATGSNLTIPSQTFTNANGRQLTIRGSGTLAIDELRIEYAVSGFTSYEANIVAKRKP